MPTYKTPGIVIKRKSINDTDRIITIITKNHGKVNAIAKGVKKPLSKLAGHLELFYLSDLIIAEGKNLHTITGAELVKNYYGFKNNIEKINYAYYFAELIDKLVDEKVIILDIYNLLDKVYAQLEMNFNPINVCYFEIQLLNYLGHKPEAAICVKCQNSLSESKNSFSNKFGGILCGECQEYDLERSDLSVNAIKVLRLLNENDFKVINRVVIDRQTLKMISEITSSFIQSIAERKLVSFEFLKKF